jgi:hypothetical protein
MHCLKATVASDILKYDGDLSQVDSRLRIVIRASLSIEGLCMPHSEQWLEGTQLRLASNGMGRFLIVANRAPSFACYIANSL